jgi:hypothetical protein
MSTIDINVSPTIEEVVINTTEFLTTINVNTITVDGIESVSAGVGIDVNILDANNPIISNTGVLTVTGTLVNNTDPKNPIVNMETPTLQVTVTKAELDALITASELIAGATYKITGVHPALYNDGTTSGTTIYLTALTTNTLSVDGSGEFYNPDYVIYEAGFGIYTPYVECGVSGVVGIFDSGEDVTSNNGATGTLFRDVVGGFILPLTGDWGASTSIVGDVTGATADISGVLVPIYAIDDVYIWGGYVWKNLTGNIGAIVDVLTLNSDWEKLEYSSENYVKVINPIKYDIDNDWISYREDFVGNKVEYTYLDRLVFLTAEGIELSSISTFQWGCSDLFLGTYNVVVNNGYCENINFRGVRNSNNTYEQGSYNSNNTYGQGSSNSSNTYGQGSQNYNNTYGQGSANFNNTYEQDSYNFNNTYGQYSQNYNNTYGQGSSNSSNTYGQDSYNYNNTYGQYSYNFNNTYGQGSSNSSNTYGQGSYNSNNTYGQYSYNFNNTYGQYSYNYNNTYEQGSQNYNGTYMQSSSNHNNIYPANKSILALILEQYSEIDNVDFTTATLIFGNFPKTIYKRPDGATRIRYYNNSDTLVFALITD